MSATDSEVSYCLDKDVTEWLAEVAVSRDPAVPGKAYPYWPDDPKLVAVQLEWQDGEDFTMRVATSREQMLALRGPAERFLRALWFVVPIEDMQAATKVPA